LGLIHFMWKKFKRWTSPSFLSDVIEIHRISSIPRFLTSETKIFGKKFVFSDSASFIQSYHEIFEQKLYHFHSERNVPFILDCGTNIGLSILYYKRIYPNARIIGFEPDPQLFNILAANLRQFGYEDVELHQKAVLDEDSKVSFMAQGGASGHVHDGHSQLETGSVLVEVDAAALSPFINREIDFLKIDIEGAEYKVLRSIAAKLHLVKRLFVEYHSFKTREQELDLILGLLRNAKFRYYLYPAIDKEFPFQGIGEVEGMDMQLNIYAIRE